MLLFYNNEQLVKVCPFFYAAVQRDNIAREMARWK